VNTSTGFEYVSIRNKTLYDSSSPMMAKLDYIDFQGRTQPLAYLITFRCYGTWLHGDERGSIDRRNYNRYGTPAMPANRKLLADERADLGKSVAVLKHAQRGVVELAIREVCEHRSYLLHAVNVRTNHVHSVVTAPCKPEHVMDSFKAYATRQLRKSGLLSRDIKPWARHGSTPYLWTEEQVHNAIDYVLNGQGDGPFIVGDN
jgi:REP element-mobilizing transposase RayT